MPSPQQYLKMYGQFADIDPQAILNKSSPSLLIPAFEVGVQEDDL